MQTPRDLNSLHRRWWDSIQYSNDGKPIPPHAAPMQEQPLSIRHYSHDDNKRFIAPQHKEQP